MLFTFSVDAQTPNTWTKKANYGGGSRNNAIGFGIGNKGYLGTGNNGTSNTSDFWEYNTATNTWTQKASFGGGARRVVTGFSIGNKGYIGTGDDGSSKKNDFWEYDTTANKWTQKASVGSSNLYGAVGFSIGNKGYIATGHDGVSTYKKDLWEYDPSSNTWTQKASFPGSARYLATGFSIGGKGYLGTGHNGVSQTKDFWAYDTTSNSWTKKADFPGVARNNCVGFSVRNRGFMGAGYDGNSDKKDFWEYNPLNNTWQSVANFGGNGKRGAVGFAIGLKGYVGTGVEGSVSTSDFWEYIPVCRPRNVSFKDTTCDVSVSPSGKYVWTTSGMYIDTLPDQYGCDSLIHVDLTVINIDTSISKTASSLISNTPSALYQWYDCQGGFSPLPGDTSRLYQPSSSGKYAVVVRDGPCSDTSSCLTFIIAGIPDALGRGVANVFPNPATDHFSISIPRPDPDLSVSVTDISGRQVYFAKRLPSSMTVDCRSWDRGVYFISFRSDASLYMFKLFKQ